MTTSYQKLPYDSTTTSCKTLIISSTSGYRCLPRDCLRLILDYVRDPILSYYFCIWFRIVLQPFDNLLQKVLLTSYRINRYVFDSRNVGFYLRDPLIRNMRMWIGLLLIHKMGGQL
jgi:hypothetical protein